jgi:iron complex outermembrane recepter protein
MKIGRGLNFVTQSASIALVSLMSANVAVAQTPSATPEAKSSEEIVVLGTRRSDRTLTTSASPVDVISAGDLNAQASSNMIDAVKNLVPSFFVGQNTISDAATFVRSPSLRGLPGDQVLVMMNGKRINRSAYVTTFAGGDTALSFGSQAPDISSIPSIAIKNLQILRDGATSQYGSDAIAGVMNFGLKDSPSGAQIIARYGQHFDNGGDGKSQQIAANLGLPLGEKGFVNISAEYNDDEGTSRGATRPSAVLFAQQNPSLASRLPNFPGPAQIWGSSPSSGWKAVVNAGYDITPNSEIYAFLNASRSEGDQSFNFRPTNAGSLVNDNGVSVNLPGVNAAFLNTYFRTPCPTGNATCPAGGFILDNNRFDFRSIYPAGFTPRFVGEPETLFGVIGYKGKLENGLSYDVSGTLAENTLALSMYDSLNASFGPASQTRFEFGAFKQKLENFNLDLSYPIEVGGLASPLTLSGGLEWRKETFTLPAGDLQSYAAGPYVNAQRLFTETTPGVFTAVTTLPTGVLNRGVPPAASGFAGTPPANAGSWSQSNYAVYVDLEADLTDRLSGGIAARFEDYDTFGSTTVGKISALFKVTDALSLRGAVGTGFQAPSPGQANLQTVTTNFVNGVQTQDGIFPVGSSVARFFGAQPLKPAEATNYGLGFVLRPAASTTLTVDAYQIDVTNRIFITQSFPVTAATIAAQPILSLVGVGGVVRYFTNGLDTSTKGVDVVATHNTELAGARLAFTAAYNYNENEVTRANPNVISTAQRITVENLAPKHRLNFNTNWSLENWTVNGRLNYYGEWINQIDYPNQTFDAKTTADLDVSYTIKEKYTITVGASNLGNVKPDKIKQSPIGAATAINVFPLTGSLADGQIYPRNGGPFGINGGFWYVRLKADF